MNWIKKIFNREESDKIVEPKVSSLNPDGSFIKEEKFEEIWILDHVDHQWTATNCLNDDDYIDYHIWADQNVDKMYKKHLPDAMVCRGVNPNIIFHGGCLGCASQRRYGIDRCRDCQYFKAQWNKPDLSIEGEKAATLSSRDLKKIVQKR